ncbi:hypothetical protein F5Y14DRAFT_410608 [Nemania sp. NC0429]|nr:hypothetical protein F5Y14DRAFT_410608 [Nemania sp. NC0429]
MASSDEKSTKAEMPAPTVDAKSSRMRTKTFFAILTVLSLAAVVFYLSHYDNPLYPVHTFAADWNDGSQWPEDPLLSKPFEPLKRYSLGYGGVACWQDDGVWIAHLTSVELSFLGIDRFKDTDRALDQADEDAFCARLRMHGASFWELPPQWPYPTVWCEDIECVKPAKEKSFKVGFPSSGGVWTLNTTGGWDGLYPRSLGLGNSLTMDERCEVLRDLGAHFCEDIQDCPEMAALMAS